MQSEFFEQECKLLRGKPTESSLVYFPNWSLFCLRAKLKYMQKHIICTRLCFLLCLTLLGLDEGAHWFVCKSGFQSRCKNLMLGSNKDLGFLKYVDEDNDVEGSVKEVWERNCLQQPLVRGNNCLYM